MFSQRVGSRSRVGVDGEVGVGRRFSGEVEGRTSRGVRSCVSRPEVLSRDRHEV